MSCDHTYPDGNGATSARRSRSTLSVLAVAGLASLALVASTGFGAAGAEAVHSRPAVPAKIPTTPIAFLDVAPVPHHPVEWADGTDARGRAVVARRRHDQWAQMPTPNFGGLGELNDIAAPTRKSVWIVGVHSTYNDSTDGQSPVIDKWNGAKFKPAKFPRVTTFAPDTYGGGEFNSIAASSARNAWAVGDLFAVSTGEDRYAAVGFHWDGSKWSTVRTHADLYDVSTSGPKNAWGLGDGNKLVHWNGKKWSSPVKAPAGVTLDDVTASSSTLAYAVGHAGSRPAVLTFDGSSWSRAKVAASVPDGNLTSVTTFGTDAWSIGDRVILHSAGKRWTTQQSLDAQIKLGREIRAVSGRRVYTVGSETVGDSTTTVFEAYDGHHWTREPSTM